MRRALFGASLLTLAVLLPTAAAVLPSAASTPSGRTALGPSAASLPRPTDWPTYGHDAQHSFHASTTLTKALVASLKPAWTFPTRDAVTATPTVVRGTVYVGSWDGWFYAVNLHTGALRWKYQLKLQPAVKPFPGEHPRDRSSDGGIVTSSAWFEPAQAGRPDLVIFGGGYTLYALDAATGGLYWSHDYTGRPDLPADPVHDGTRIFSSPVVADGNVYFASDVDGANGYRGYVTAASLATGNPVWQLQMDVDTSGQLLNDGCGNVWSSGTLLSDLGVVVFSTGDCKGNNLAPLSESVLALDLLDGHIVWTFRPSRPDVNCDVDFGASVNAATDGTGKTTFLGVGGKDGTYYSIDPANGLLRWSTNVVFGGAAGGFIGTTAYDGHRVVGSTALGDLGGPLCDPSNPRDMPFEEPTVHAFDPATGAVLWEKKHGASFGPTTIAAGMSFNGVALSAVVEVRDDRSGELLTSLPLPLPAWSGIAVVKDALILGTGTSVARKNAGIVVFTPDGRPPG